MGKRIAGPPLAFLVVLLSVEALFSLVGVQVHYVELWLVLAMVPLALLLTQGQKAPKATAKKVVQYDDDDTASDNVVNSPCNKREVVPCKPSERVRKQEKVYSFSEAARAAERADEKKRIE